MKTDEEKSVFFLSGRGYVTGIIAEAIQDDVAMAYHRCAEYKKELAALQAECDRLRKLVTECADYLDTNDMTSIGHGSVLHRKLLDDAMKGGQP